MIVETYYINGIKVNIDDSAYAGKSEEELSAVRRNIEQTARQIWQAVERRKVNDPEGGREGGLGRKAEKQKMEESIT